MSEVGQMLGLQASGNLFFIPGVAGNEWIILIALAIVLLFGAKKLPELAKSIGRATGEFQRGKQEIDREIKDASKAPPQDSSKMSGDRLVKMAKELGIDTEGKSEAELKEEIAKAMMR